MFEPEYSCTHIHTHTYIYMHTEKLIFFDVIIEDDEGETEPAEEVVPYQLSKEAIVLDMKVQDIKVMVGRTSRWDTCLSTSSHPPHPTQKVMVMHTYFLIA